MTVERVDLGACLFVASFFFLFLSFIHLENSLETVQRQVPLLVFESHV